MEKKKTIPTVVIVGRINVGKSALFNRLTETSKALVSDIAGTTRDYNLGQVLWRKKIFELVDTGGVNIDILKNSIQALLPKKMTAVGPIETEIIKQTKTALNKADLILMVTDGRAGILPEDKELALVIKKLNKPILLVCNKIDNLRWQNQVNDFFKLGLGKPLPVSASNGSGSGDLLDEIYKKIKWSAGRPKANIKSNAIRVAIIGKPNVGKSSLVNKILGENRVIVSPIPQTTREPQDTEISYQGHKIILIDTAGLRKKARIEPGLEKISTKKTVKMIESADVILFVTESDKSLTHQDNYLSGLIKEAGAGIIIIANKWDLIGEKDIKTDQQVRRHYQGYFPYLSYAPLLFISAQTGRNVSEILDLVIRVAGQRQKQVGEKELENFLKNLIKRQSPVQAKGPKRPHLYQLIQSSANPPAFTVYIGPKQSIHFSYLRYMENQLRLAFDFFGVPIKMKVVNLKH